jgi:hypothetical protein
MSGEGFFREPIFSQENVMKKQSTKASKKNTKKSTTATTKGRGMILGLPIENADHTVGTKAKEIKDKVMKAPKAPAPRKEFDGKITCTRLFTRKMSEFKNCKAEMVMALDEKNGVVIYANLYNGILPNSFKPEAYTYSLDSKHVATKVEKRKNELTEIEDPAEWPHYFTSAGPVKNGRRAKAK